MKKVNLILILFVCLGTISFSQTVTIGTQVWMTKNLDVSKFRNGDPIPEAKTTEEWENAGKNKQPAWCYYDNDPKNGEKYGKLYNWYAVSDSRGLAPEGWRVPSNDEWTVLETYLGVTNVMVKLKSTSGWKKRGNGNNSSGFSGLPGGLRYGEGTFGHIGYNGKWWSSTEHIKSDQLVYCRGMQCNLVNVDKSSGAKWWGFSVRCIKD
jgi:uncharacterized protein (TIGR02145 family)